VNRTSTNISSFIVVTLASVAAGLAFIYLGRSPTYQAMLVLMAAGVLGLLILTEFGITREFLLFGLGFAIVISPVKDFGFQEGDPHYMWVIQNNTFSAFDAALLIFIALYARNIFSTACKWLPRPVLFLIIGYVCAMLVSLLNIGPSGHMDVAITQFIYEMRCFLVFAAVFTLILHPGPKGCMVNLRYILIGFSCATLLETAIVCLEYVGAIQAGPLLMGVRVGSFLEGLAMGETLRVGGTFQHPNYLVIFAGVAFLLLWQTEMDSHPEASRSPLYWPGMIGAFLCLILTLSRSGWAGTAAGGMVYVCIMLVGRGYPWFKSLPWKYVVPCLVVTIAVGFYFSDSIINKIFHSASDNLTSRYYMNEMALLIWLENVWSGVGLGQHGFAMASMSRFGEMRVAMKNFPAVHNSYLLILSEIGIVGALFYFLIPFYAVASGLRTCLKKPNHRATAILCGACTGVIIYLVADLASISLRHLTLPLVYWFLLGMIFGLARVVREESKHHPKPLKGGKMP